MSWEDPTYCDSIEIEFDRSNSDVGITDPTWFAESIFCLIANAVKYSKRPGGIKVEIKQLLTENEEFSEFSVQDSGISLSPQVLDMLFDPPVQVLFRSDLFFYNFP